MTFPETLLRVVVAENHYTVINNWFGLVDEVFVYENGAGDGGFPNFLETHINPNFSKGVKLLSEGDV